MPARALWLSLSFFLVLVARVAVAQEVLEDQDPIDPDWAPAWDVPFWPTPTGAVLEIVGGRQGGQVPLLEGSALDRAGEVASGDYVLALLTLPLGARARQQGPSAGEDSDRGAGDSGQAEEAPLPERRSSGQGGAGSEEPSVEAALPEVPAAPRSASPARTAASPPQASPPQVWALPEEMPLSLLQDAVDQAEKAAGFGSSLRSLASIRHRARWSGLAPELRLRGATGIDQTRSIDSAGLVPSDQTQRDGVDSLVEVRLTFHLERLLHSGQEVALERARHQLLAERADVRGAVGRDLVTYVRARRRLALDSLEDEERDRIGLLAEQARLSLYLLTGGWFRGEDTLERYQTSHQ